ncbi:hypothetical protein RvY_17445 [Ramazzottius varieornatus]|uniref:Uncharacterized protein n=1 Tax=Ramazzottius varieornatus TaxID=947166 RepID=A0A1D1W254_RAMVA|nr:hypothetical protein RvY_17445 [Ramazzottius varieornatus]
MAHTFPPPIFRYDGQMPSDPTSRFSRDRLRERPSVRPVFRKDMSHCRACRHRFSPELHVASETTLRTKSPTRMYVIEPILCAGADGQNCTDSKRTRALVRKVF